MYFSSKQFEGCGFPEQWLFWFSFIDGAIFVICMMLLIAACHRAKVTNILATMFCPIYSLFNPRDLPREALLIQKVGLASGVLLLFSVLTLFFGLKTGVFECGAVSYE